MTSILQVVVQYSRVDKGFQFGRKRPAALMKLHR